MKDVEKMIDRLFLVLVCYAFVIIYSLSVWSVCFFEGLKDITSPSPSVVIVTDTEIRQLHEMPKLILPKIENKKEEESADLKEGSAEVEEIEETVKYFDAPLEEDLQDHIFALCEEYDIDPSIVIAMIERESSFRVSIMGDNGNSYGLMQIQPRWNKERMEALGCLNLLDPYQNTSVGIHLLNELLDKNKGVEWALMAYNGGQSYANKKLAKGEISEYASMVLSRSRDLRTPL